MFLAYFNYTYFFSWIPAAKSKALSTYLASDQSFPTQISFGFRTQYVSVPLGSIILELTNYTLCVVFSILVSLFSPLCSCTINSKAKINVFWNFFFTPLAPSGPLCSKKFQKTLILAFEANSALSRENETKIVKITHSVPYFPQY